MLNIVRLIIIRPMLLIVFIRFLLILILNSRLLTSLPVHYLSLLAIIFWFHSGVLFEILEVACGVILFHD